MGHGTSPNKPWKVDIPCYKGSVHFSGSPGLPQGASPGVIAKPQTKHSCPTDRVFGDQEPKNGFTRGTPFKPGITVYQGMSILRAMLPRVSASRVVYQGPPCFEGPMGLECRGSAILQYLGTSDFVNSIQLLSVPLRARFRFPGRFIFLPPRIKR